MPRLLEALVSERDEPPADRRASVSARRAEAAPDPDDERNPPRRGRRERGSRGEGDQCEARTCARSLPEGKTTDSRGDRGAPGKVRPMARSPAAPAEEVNREDDRAAAPPTTPSKHASLTPWRMSRRPPDYLVADELCVLLDPLVRFIPPGVRASSEAYASGAQRQESG